MDKGKVIRYFLLFDAYNRDNSFSFNDEQFNFINEVNKYARSDEEFNELINKLKSTSYYDREAIIEEYYDTKQKKSLENESEVIAKTFGIDISKINHNMLNSGIEVFSFYDFNVGKMVVLENRKDGKSLVEQLKEMQTQSSLYQSSNSEKNAHDMLSDERVNSNIELKMIPINQINNYLEQVKSLKKEDYMALGYLIKNANYFGIDYINIENMFGISKSGKVYEVRHDNEKGYQIGEANSISYNENDLDVSSRFDGDADSVYNDYEDIGYVTEKDVENCEFNYLSDEDKELTVSLYENPKELENISEERKKVYTKYIEMYKKYLLLLAGLNLTRKKSNVKKKVLEKDDFSGFINTNGLLLIIEFVVITVITFVLFNIIFK